MIWMLAITTADKKVDKRYICKIVSKGHVIDDGFDMEGEGEV